MTFNGEYSHDDEWSSMTINQVIDLEGNVVGYIFVIDRGKRDPKWKLPGGHKEARDGKDPLKTAMRENQGETGLRLPEEAYQELRDLHQWKFNHWALFFLAKVPLADVGKINEFDNGNEGEEVAYFTLAETVALERARMILHPHFVKMKDAGCTLA